MSMKAIEFRSWVKQCTLEWSDPEFIYRIQKLKREYGRYGLDFIEMIHMAQYRPYAFPMFRSDLLYTSKIFESDEDAFIWCVSIGLTIKEMIIIGIRGGRPVFNISYYGLKKIAAFKPRLQFLLDSYYACAPIDGRIHNL